MAVLRLLVDHAHHSRDSDALQIALPHGQQQLTGAAAAVEHLGIGNNLLVLEADVDRCRPQRQAGVVVRRQADFIQTGLLEFVLAGIDGGAGAAGVEGNRHGFGPLSVRETACNTRVSRGPGRGGGDRRSYRYLLADITDDRGPDNAARLDLDHSDGVDGDRRRGVPGLSAGPRTETFPVDLVAVRPGLTRADGDLVSVDPRLPGDRPRLPRRLSLVDGKGGTGRTRVEVVQLHLAGATVEAHDLDLKPDAVADVRPAAILEGKQPGRDFAPGTSTSTVSARVAPLRGGSSTSDSTRNSAR